MLSSCHWSEEKTKGRLIPWPKKLVSTEESGIIGNLIQRALKKKDHLKPMGKKGEIKKISAEQNRRLLFTRPARIINDMMGEEGEACTHHQKKLGGRGKQGGKLYSNSSNIMEYSIWGGKLKTLRGGF